VQQRNHGWNRKDGPSIKEDVMGLRINQNIAAFNAYRNLSVTEGQMSKTLEKLSSGFRINRAADDAAGLSISEGLRSQIGGLKTAVRNAQDGVSVVQTAEGALTETHAILQRMRDLAVQASNSGSQDLSARKAAHTEFQQLNAELDRIGNTTRFGDSRLLDGSFGAKASTLAGAVTGGSVSVAAASSNNTFSISGSFEQNGSPAASGALAVTVADGTYNTAADFQTALQNGLDAAFTNAGFAAGTVKAEVTDSGNGVWKVALSSTKQASGDTFATTSSTLTGGVENGTSSAAGTAGGTFQVGAKAGETMIVNIGDMRSSTLGTSTLNLEESASAAITALDTAIGKVSTQRANLGAFQNRFEHAINNLNVAVENLSASESRIRDTDMAQAMVAFTRAQILSQAGTAMLAQANQAPQGVMQLLR
jgi:flagellin